MPWTKIEVERHIKGLGDKQKEAWVKIANKALKDCQEKGGTDCEGRAIRIANAMAKRVKASTTEEELKQMEMEFSEKETYDVDNKEIFRVGEWKGDQYTEQDLDRMVLKIKGKFH